MDIGPRLVCPTTIRPRPNGATPPWATDPAVSGGASAPVSQPVRTFVRHTGNANGTRVNRSTVRSQRPNSERTRRVRFLHAADLHLDTPVAKLRSYPPEVHAALRDAS